MVVVAEAGMAVASLQGFANFDECQVGNSIPGYSILGPEEHCEPMMTALYTQRTRRGYQTVWIPK